MGNNITKWGDLPSPDVLTHYMELSIPVDPAIGNKETLSFNVGNFGDPHKTRRRYATVDESISDFHIQRTVTQKRQKNVESVAQLSFKYGVSVVETTNFTFKKKKYSSAEKDLVEKIGELQREAFEDYLNKQTHVQLNIGKTSYGSYPEQMTIIDAERMSCRSQWTATATTKVVKKSTWTPEITSVSDFTLDYNKESGTLNLKYTTSSGTNYDYSRVVNVSPGQSRIPQMEWSCGRLIAVSFDEKPRGTRRLMSLLYEIDNAPKSKRVA